MSPPPRPTPGTAPGRHLAGSLVKHSAWQRAAVAVALLCALWLVLLASLSTGD
ncbi:MAG: hypothetical protein Q8S32_06840 [Burkholderiaceae bacterium]|nr:hypothetical protein [Burkholderiaceae bacterium]